MGWIYFKYNCDVKILLNTTKPVGFFPSCNQLSSSAAFFFVLIPFPRFSGKENSKINKNERFKEKKVSNMDDNDSLSALLCLENVTSLEENEELVDEYYLNENDEESVKLLLDRENSFGFKKNESLVLTNFFKYSRLKAIRWILRTREVFGFRFQTAFLSVFYFDRFLSKKSIDCDKSWAMQLLSMACLSLSKKMEERQLPALSKFQAEEFNFESKLIPRMELLVLNTLGWRINSITPFCFLHFFIAKLCKESPPHQFISRSVELILAVMREINLMEHRPSVIAAAATLRAWDERLTRNKLECKLDSVSYCGFLEIEDVFSCYNLMQKLEKSVNSPDLSPQHLRAINVLDDSSSSAAVCTNKWKRLTFNTS